jgi:hypothetical protein
MSDIRPPNMCVGKLSFRVRSEPIEGQLRLPRIQSSVRAPALNIQFHLADQAPVRDLFLRFHMMAHDTSAIPSINKATANMRKFGGAVIQGRIVRSSFGLVDSLPISWSGVKRTVMEKAIKPRMIMSHPANRKPLQRNCNLRRRSNRRAASIFGDFIRVPCECIVAVEMRFVPHNLGKRR